jgi:hypothetical protein
METQVLLASLVSQVLLAAMGILARMASPESLEPMGRRVHKGRWASLGRMVLLAFPAGLARMELQDLWEILASQASLAKMG